MSELRSVAARLALCMSAIAGLFWASQVLPAPPARISAWALWWDRTGPLLALFSVARSVVLVALAAWMLALVLTTLVLAGRTGRRGISRYALSPLCRLAALPLARSLLGISAAGALFAGCSGAASSGPGSGDSATGTPSPPIIVNTAPPAAAPAASTTTTTTTPAAEPAAGSPPTAGYRTGNRDRQAASLAAPTHRTGTDNSPHRTPNAVPGHRTPSEDRPAAAARARRADSGNRTWTVRPGDDLWSVAEATVRAAGSPIPVAPYWRALIDANRSRIPDPDLIFPGDVLRLPPVP